MEEQNRQEVSQQLPVSENSGPEVVVAENADPTKTYMTDQFVEQANGIYHAALQEIRKTKITRGGVLRALDFAATRGLSARSLGIKLKSKEEGKLAELISLMLENRLILMAAAMKQNVEQQTVSEGEPTNVTSES